MMEFLFERPIEMAVILGIVWGFVLFLWLATRLSIWKKTLVIWGLFVILMPVINWAYHTPSERAQETLKVMLQKIQQRNMAAVLNFLDKRYRDHGLSYTFFKRNKRLLSQWKVDNLEFRLIKAKRLSSGKVELSFVCSGQLLRGGRPFSFKDSVWKIRFRQLMSSKRWVIDRVKVVNFTLENHPTPTSFAKMLRMRT